MNYMHTNIALEIMSIVILIIMIGCQVINGEKRLKANKYFVLMMLLMVALFTFDLLSWLVDKKVGMIYYIDEHNYFHWGRFYWIPHVVGVAFYVIAIGIIWRERKRLGRYSLFSYLAYASIPLIAVLLNAIFYEVVFLSAAMTLAFLIVFVNFQMQREKRIKEQELVLRNQQIEIMLSQIQPHFLYNSLTAIVELCKEYPDAKKAILIFSKYLRFNMESISQKELIPFESELEYTKQYLYLEELSYKDKIDIEYNIQVKAFMIPALSLQPVVESIVSQGAGLSEEQAVICIETKEDEKEYRIEVTNSIQGMIDQNHIGIMNVRTRLQAICGGDIAVKDVLGNRTCIVVTIPKIVV